MFIVLTSCDTVTENEIQKEQEKANLEKNIGPLALEYLVKYVYYWDLEKYTPVSNKKLGIWLPRNSYLYTIAKDKFGFNSLLIQDGWTQQTAINVGYDSLQLVGMIPHNRLDYEEFIDMYKKVGAYYIDEPFERDEYDEVALKSVINYIRTNAINYNAPFLIGSYKSGGEYYNFFHNNSIDINVYMMNDNYNFPPLWEDQRTDWTTFKSLFGARNISNWISIDRDYAEYQDLLGHANNLNIAEIWLYANCETPIEQYLYAFADQAWKTSWLLKVERRYRKEYRCYERDCELDDNWQLYGTVPLNQYRTLTYNQNQE